MRKLKNYFKMMITAVICFVMNFVPGKKGKEVLEKLLFGQETSNQKGTEGFIVDSADTLVNAENVPVCKKSLEIGYKNNRYKLYLNHVFVPAVGPGDWKHAVQENQDSDVVMHSIIAEKNGKIVPFPLEREKKEICEQSFGKNEIKTLLYETSG